MILVYIVEKFYSFKICRKFFYSVIYIVFFKKFRIIYNNIIFFVNVCSVEKIKWKKGKLICMIRLSLRKYYIMSLINI